MCGAADQLQLRRLVDLYGIAIDRRDPMLLSSLFTEDGGIDVYRPGYTDPTTVIRGPAQLEAIVEALRLYERTFHFVGNFVAEIERDCASGVTYCVAHHWLLDDTTSLDEVLLLTYDDRFTRTVNGWRFVLRSIRRSWAAFLPVSQDPLAIDMSLEASDDGAV